MRTGKREPMCRTKDHEQDVQKKKRNPANKHKKKTAWEERRGKTRGARSANQVVCVKWQKTSKQTDRRTSQGSKAVGRTGKTRQRHQELAGALAKNNNLGGGTHGSTAQSSKLRRYQGGPSRTRTGRIQGRQKMPDANKIETTRK